MAIALLLFVHRPAATADRDPDRNDDGRIDKLDVQRLWEELATSRNDPTADLTGDGVVDLLDLARLSTMAEEASGSAIAALTPPPEIELAVEYLLARLDVPDTARIILSGPVIPGSLIREDIQNLSTPNLEMEVLYGESPLAFTIDLDPRARLTHETIWGWVDVATGQLSAAAGHSPIQIQGPEGLIEPFKLKGIFRIQGREAVNGTGGGGGVLHDISAKAEAGAITGNSGTANVVRRALVVDLGDKDGNFWSGNGASAFAADADAMNTYLAGKGFTVQRISQYWGNAASYLPLKRPLHPLDLAKALDDIIKSYQTYFECPADTTFCHELFIYVSGHAVQAPLRAEQGMMVFSATGGGESGLYPYGDLKQSLRKLPRCVRVILFIDACYSGQAIPIMEDTYINNPAHPSTTNMRCTCGFTTITSTNAAKPASQGHGALQYDSSTEDFFQGADQDYNQNGVNGDFFDRWEHMRREGQGYSFPQRSMCPGQTSMWSVD